MKAAVIRELGATPAYDDFDEPVAGDGEVIAEVRAASLKNLDRALAAGTHYGSSQVPLPSVAGVDGVAVLPDGRRVFTGGASAPFGMMAERVAVNPARVMDVPEDIDDVVAAALPNPGASAWFSLEYAGQIQPGQSVLVLGGTGVTGSMAVQLAKAQFGAGRVVVAGRNTDRLERLAAWGADATIDLAGDVRAQVEQQHREHPFDLVLDYLWGGPAEQTLLALGNDDLGGDYHRTRYVQIGEMAGSRVSLPGGVLRSVGLELVGQGGGSIPKEALVRVGSEILPRLFALLAEGSLHVDVRQRALAEVATVWDEPEPSGTRTVLLP
ncbi:quinone oxidoreductase family protein [Luteipulveratus mongoliensis]|uniref:Alcohol dehydrogenase n=1 Tax=Luteipulveratus mongoliensis TaxID=571913 RepID=A0A0K1JLH9_9MICO|nr:zinc-binding alcohol dehydrogenase family protein [Luteipulveratus mongoliensis]AKU17430.1 alcohol dehydrogenase [Luteipulveratus mongoliensis]